ncbi:MAG TPA: phosphotransferase [Pyrinomonadaceae bacterium]|nr:phosphotransferase [Chloracidobacterium sp.]MBP9935989.1 phosphotransferase [Pyrinomonadaceae bacterium]MBK7803900.1 phosphotransferase [Chloracidobacterium sp.]MBK9439429.1 phosphotransferase [Chloracidobacterium sp.]MBK9768269.1 phosphotransferase [Chloracidobacterium sp.]
MSEYVNRLKQFLEARGQSTEFTALTADASTREYYRIQWKGASAIGCVYPESFIPEEQNYIDATKLFLASHLPVAEIYDFDGGLGVIIQEDLGDTVLRDVLLEAPKERSGRLLNEAISLIARIQTATPIAFEMDSIASRLKFDREKLLWELNFFKTHYFETYLSRPLDTAEDAAISAEFDELAADLEKCAVVLCHRDFHAANLMLDSKGQMRIIDHQDARIGSPAYDLVSLLLDRITVPPPPEWLADRRRYFLDVRRTLGMPKIDEDDFACEFRLQTIQRCLKAVGTFSYQSAVRGKTYFIPFIQPMFRIVDRAIGNVDRFPRLRSLIESELESDEVSRHDR